MKPVLSKTSGLGTSKRSSILQPYAGFKALSVVMQRLLERVSAMRVVQSCPSINAADSSENPALSNAVE